MEIRKITRDDVSELISFGLNAFPERIDYYSDLIKFLYSDKFPGEASGVVLVDEEGKIRGQNLCESMTLWNAGMKKDLWWGHDLIVEEQLRNDAWGIELLIGSQKHFPLRCGTGSGKDSTAMALKLKFTIIGEIRKYIVPSSLSNLILGLFPKKINFPDKVNNFKLIKNISDFKSKDFFNNDLIESGRDSKWVDWRYFTPEFKKYHLYQDEGGDWFVLRVIKIKGIKMMLVSDFRCSLKNEEDFSAMLKTIKEISSKMHVPFILFGSSHKVTDSVLAKNHGKSIGAPRPIIFPKQLKDWMNPEKSKERNYCLITFGDCDGEWSW